MNALEINQLKKTYNNGFEALKGIDLNVRKGDFFALLGPNGAGKSTIIGIICSLINKTSGHVSIRGYDLKQFPREAKQSLGIVPQEFNFNVFEPVEEILVNQAGYYGVKRPEAFKRAEVHLKQLDLWDKRREMARDLSGGMKRRLMIARALMHEPQILILDEPTAGVDIEIRRSMWAFLQEINKQGTTIILTTHYLEEAEQLCKNIAIINQGAIIKNCAMVELLSELDSECMVLNLQAPLKKAPSLEHYSTRLIDQTTLEVEIKKDEDVNTLFNLLNKQQIKVLSIRNKSNRLEQLFLRIVEK
ncbi:MAG: ABC transporter ATP-binding protein [gamma proteobacterium symbiont of Bathyaustriella thionipta]|nr:ABC transporter ATP-binding protein [gamma proteobacterium symbiont of Bathyaustriella thionipta]MCU7950595.1 ABC transporter ATP-binding protein [gamma proteobacterium symbiont of Bathyaustriella thionipta]MCU7953530.1 ABC transporter ATP-binding protein [gamma proteobacterium symbiont of Bathyaustriella thionipta]MCU7957103.1 ABC transporter ATP-binding protein [gamma proteobacterium symbiont of Bathyaustriella thionipta]MCU7966573.1 ABC transporter ATP-binding protein [gamma proteobacteri